VCPICTPYVGYIKSKNFQKSKKKKKAKKSQKGPIFQKSQKKSQKSKIIQKIWIFFFGKLKLFWKFLDFLEKFVILGTSLLFVISEAT
jgi:hypothetical protein